MKFNPSLLFLLLVVGIPGILVFFVPQPSNSRTPNKRPNNGSGSTVDSAPVDNDLAQQAQVSKDMTRKEVPEVRSPSRHEREVASEQKSVLEARAQIDQIKRLSHEVEKYLPEQWQQLEQQFELARRVSMPASILQLEKQIRGKVSSIQARLPSIKLRRELEESQSKEEPLEFLNRLQNESKNSWADSTVVEPFWNSIYEWGPDVWMQMVKAQVKELSPSDDGFSEVYLALADYNRHCGREAATNQAEQIAWENSKRMTNPERAAQSAIATLQRMQLRLPQAEMAKRALEAKTIATDVSNLYSRMKLLAEIGSLSRTSGIEPLKDIQQTVAKANSSDERMWTSLYEGKLRSATAAPNDLRRFVESIRMTEHDFEAKAIGYSYIANSAAREKDDSAFWYAMLQAEAQLLDCSGDEVQERLATIAVAQSDFNRGDFRRVLFSSLKINDVGLRGRLLFPLMVQSRNLVPIPIGKLALQVGANNPQGCLAFSNFVPRLIEDQQGKKETIGWILSMKQPSLRIAGLIGLARAAVDPMVASELDMSAKQSRSAEQLLLAKAENEASLLQMPLKRAWAHLWIAVCWKTLKDEENYRRVLKRIDRDLDGWWYIHETDNDRQERRPSGFQQENTESLPYVVEFYTHMAELQAFSLDDPRQSIENVINAARASHPAVDTLPNAFLKVRLWVIVEYLHSRLGFPASAMNGRFNPPNMYHQALLAVAKNDFASLQSLVKQIEAKKQIADGFELERCLGHGYGEVAIAAAKKGDLDTYRSFRRRAQEFAKDRSKGNEYLVLPLYEADAYAGEFDLSIGFEKINRLPFYGSVGRTKCAICRQLSKRGRTDDALKFLPSTREPFYRIQSMHAIASTKHSNASTESVESLLKQHEEPLDRIGILCGIATKQSIPD